MVERLRLIAITINRQLSWQRLWAPKSTLSFDLLNLMINWSRSRFVDWIRKFEERCYRLSQIILLKILLCYHHGSICSMQWLIKCTVPGSRGFNLKQYWTQESNVPQSKIGRNGSTKKIKKLSTRNLSNIFVMSTDGLTLLHLGEWYYCIVTSHSISVS